MPPLVTKNLGIAAAIHVGATNPTNIKMLWYNTGDNLHYYYDVLISDWVLLKSNVANLADLDDVDLTGITTGDVLQYNGANWQPQTLGTVAFSNDYNDLDNLPNLGLYQLLSQKGFANGYVPLNGSTKIDATYLPSYVDDVVEYADLASFPITGETGKIYTALDTEKIYRWSGSIYVELNPMTIPSFLDLTDTPNSYTGESLKGVRVNAGETALEFYTITSGPSGSGTNNYISKWTPDGNTLGDSLIQDNGTRLGVGVVPDATSYFTIQKSENLFNHQLKISNPSLGNTAMTSINLVGEDSGLILGVAGASSTVNTSYGINGAAFLYRDITTTAKPINYINESGNHLFYSNVNATGAATLAVVGNSVGIGTSAPTNLLKIGSTSGIGEGSANFPFIVAKSIGNTKIEIANTGTAAEVGMVYSESASKYVEFRRFGSTLASNLGSTTIPLADLFEIDNYLSGSGAGRFTISGSTIYLGRNTSATNSYLKVTGSGIYISQADDMVASATSRLHIKTATGSSGLGIYTSTGDSIIYTNDSGFTGFGTASPSYRIHSFVDSNDMVNVFFGYNNNGGTSTATRIIAGNAAGEMQFGKLYSGSTWSQYGSANADAFIRSTEKSMNFQTGILNPVATDAFVFNIGLYNKTTAELVIGKTDSYFNTNLELKNSWIKTGDPAGLAGEWKLGKNIVAASTLDATQYIEVQIDGATVKLARIV